jgi:hypothetical protein
MRNPPTLIELAEKAIAIIKAHPELANLEVTGWDDGTINLDSFDDIWAHTPDELWTKYRQRRKLP